MRFVRDEVFPFFQSIGKRAGTNFMDGARLDIGDPAVLSQVVDLVDQLDLNHEDADTKGDLFEHILKQIRQAGELGQFRTPRHVIRMIVSLVDPQIGETVYDPAAGTAGFLVAAYEHVQLANSDPATVVEVERDGEIVRRGHGDLLSDAQWNQLRNATFYGNDVDAKMVRLATMNLTLRGLENVRILRRNVLTSTLDRQQRRELNLPEAFDVVLANPPFSGTIDADRIVDDVKVGGTKATEILFLKYMMESLRVGGRCGVILPEGVLFGSTSAHKEIRRQLLENNTLHAVVSLPGGVFQPYSGVKTAVLVFSKGGRTERVWFYEVTSDGYKLDAQHNTPIDDDDLPDVIAQFRRREEAWQHWQQTPRDEWNEKCWLTTADDIRAHDYNLAAGRYKPHRATAANHDHPAAVLREVLAMEEELTAEMRALLGEVEET